MKEYDFRLKFRLGSANEDAGKYLEALAEVGCDDALVGVGQNGRVSLHFIRAADSAMEALTSAVANARKAIPDAKLIEADPDYVGVTDIADFFGVSRQNVRKLIQSKGASFPDPVHEGNPSLWHLADVLRWFQEEGQKGFSSEALEVAQVTMQLNVLNCCMKASVASGNGFYFDARAPSEELRAAMG
ncbi:helix-turn-helix transcriptional regulator [Thiohalorhabdus sp. Cl-TMA]|uniref:Helix-turn-helix transcriptional regulator n=1 Tax=Thiohalorhabdus methylotrophus TaxID=3242694 RepID=A0ABV4TX96_9GAMM